MSASPPSLPLSRSNKSWQAKISIQGQSVHLGYFADRKDAEGAIEAAISRREETTKSV